MGISATTALAIGVGVAGVATAAGTMYAANKQADATRRANDQSAAATAQFKEDAKAESERGFKDTNELLETYQPSQLKLTQGFSSGLNANVDKYALDTEAAIANYNQSVAQLVGKADANASAFALRSGDLAKRSADETFNYNLSRVQDFTNFATRLSEENQNIRQNLINAANPGWEAQKQQANLTNLQMQQGILPADVAAQVARAGAEGSVASGVFNSGLATNRTARDFGLTSLDLMQKGQQNALIWGKNIYDQEVAGNQVGVQDVYNTNGLNVQQVYQTNQANNLALLQAQNVGLEYGMTGLNNALSTKGTAATNTMTSRNAALSQAYTQESETLRDYISGKVGAVTDRTNVALGIEAQGLSNAYASANRTLQSGLASANMVGSAISQVGGAFGGMFASGAFSNGLSQLSSYGAMRSARGSYQDLNLSGIPGV